MNIVKEYRESVFLIDEQTNKIEKINFENWGAGELKISTLPEIQSTVNIAIPYLTFNTLEKAYILKRFLEKKGITIEATRIGYFSYSRQERETEKEPELLSEIIKIAKRLLGTIVVMDGHNKESFTKQGVLTISFLPKLLTYIEDEYFVVAPDKGAKARNFDLGIETHICLNKCRKDGQVITELGEVSNDVVDGKTFVILDDICDGGRTFANAATILKEYYPNSKVILAVAHAILPFGVELLKEKGIDQIISSDTCYPIGEYFDGFLKVF
ncbi:phosphoribosyltransferase family protein (plasmid) [Clostridium perfringens]|nr:hypothetical protein [Clostridium perfringens]